MTRRPEPLVVGTGEVAIIPTDAVDDQLDKLLKAARATNSHLWCALTSYHVADPSRGMLVLDRNTMISTPVVGCYRCETGWRPGMQDVPCEGDVEEDESDGAVGHAD